MLSRFSALLTITLLSACASITNDAFVPVALSMSDGSEATCVLTNKRGRWEVDLPDTPMIRRSDDALKYSCETENGADAHGAIESTIGAKIVASAVFIDLGITDAITDKHREYPASFVIPVKGAKVKMAQSKTPREAPAEVQSVADAMMCSDKIEFDKTDGVETHWTLTCEDEETIDVLCAEGSCSVR